LKIGSPRRAPGALLRYTGLVLVLACAVASVGGGVARSAAEPKIVSVDVSGNLHVPTATIMAVIQAHPGEPFDPRVVQDDLARLQALGYFAAVPPPLIRQRDGGVAITYRVVENPVITKIVFEGNRTVPSDTLLALMDTAVGQVFNTNTFRQDVLKINSYYEKIGFAGQVPSHVKNLELDPKTGVLTLDIVEGLTIRHVLIGGDPLLPPSVILPVLQVKPGVEYSDQLRDEDYKALQKLYEKYKIYVGNFEGGIKQSSIDLKNDTADVEYDIWVAKVAAVQITGNTRTKDIVIRRQLTLLPGMVLSSVAIKRDYERLMNLGFFSKVEPDVKPGPDPKKPQDVTVVWHVTEQRTASANIGVGYSGGINGQGLYGTLGYSDNDLHGTGNAVQVQFERGVRTYTSQISASIPYVGNTPKLERYSVSASLFSNGTTFYYPIYAVAPTGIATVPSVGGTPAPIPVTLYPSGTTPAVSGVASTSTSKAAGISLQVGRRFNYYTQLLLGLGAQSISTSTTVPPPYYFQSAQLTPIVGPTPNPLTSLSGTALGGSFGIAASSIAFVNNGAPYRLYTLSVGAQTNTLDDYFNPRSGWTASIDEVFSNPSFGSNFNFTQTQLNLTHFRPLPHAATIGVHGEVELSTGIIPPSSLYTFSDQQLRGYNSIFYGTDVALGQIEYRIPLVPDRQLSAAAFIDQGAFRIRGAAPILDPLTNRILSYPSQWTLRSDFGVGLRVAVPQLLGNQVIRIDIAHGIDGTHTSFGIGQSF
jgi:outer membrane protein assembly factor BamA